MTPLAWVLTLLPLMVIAVAATVGMALEFQVRRQERPMCAPHMHDITARTLLRLRGRCRTCGHDVRAIADQLRNWGPA